MTPKTMARPSVLVTSGIVLTRDTGMEGDIWVRGLVILVIVWPALLQEVMAVWGGVCRMLGFVFVLQQ